MKLSKIHMCEIVGGGRNVGVVTCVLYLISLLSCCGIIGVVCFQGIFKPMDLNRIIKLLEEDDKVRHL